MGLPNDTRLAQYLPLINYCLYRSVCPDKDKWKGKVFPGILTVLWCNSPVCGRSNLKTSHCLADPVLRNNQRRKYRVSNDAMGSSMSATGRENPGEEGAVARWEVL